MIPANADLRDAWDQIQAGKIKPYLQPQEDMLHRLEAAVNRYGIERVPFAGPECGLGSWNWQYGDIMVLANLQNLQRIVAKFNHSHNLPQP
jgi:hypothetical protein